MKHIPFVVILLAQLSYTQNIETVSTDITVSDYIEGTLLTPTDSIYNKTLAIIIAGSGPTDRDGNQNFLKCDALKKLAYGLAEQGFSSFRYDKRVVKDLKMGIYDNDYLFDDFIDDAKDVVVYFRNNKAYHKIIVIGHSQGSLIAMLASKGANGIVSIAGPSESIDVIISKQIKQNAPELSVQSDRIIAVLKSGKTTDDYPPVLGSIFNKTVQPFLINWMNYTPSEILSKIEIPSLILNGSNDLQIESDQAIQLAEVNSYSKLSVIQDMNHVLVNVSKDPLENAKSYNEPHRPISSDLIKVITLFMKSL